MQIEAGIIRIINPNVNSIYQYQIMEEVFIEQLDQIHWQGYGEQFRENNPAQYQKQLNEFIDNYKTPKHGISNSLFNGSCCSTNRTYPNIRYSKRGRNTGRI